MPETYILTKRNTPLVVLEMMGASALLVYWLHRKYDFDWVMILVLFFVFAGTLLGLFLTVRWIRYLLAIAFSLFWGILVYYIVQDMTTSTASPWVAGGFVVFISLVLHKSFFDIETS